MSKTDAAKLREARALIADPSRWCRHRNAENADGLPCDPRGPKAIRWCLNGAFEWSGADLRAWRVLRDTLGSAWTLTAFNDTHTHAEVLALLDRAIQLAEAVP